VADDLPPPLDWQAAGIGPGPDVPIERRVTRDNWRLYPFSRWAFQHARELVPSRALPAAATPRPLPAAPVDLAGLTFTDPAGGERTLANFLATGYHDALLVLHRGRLAWAHLANGMGLDRPHMLFSVTKSLVGVAAERLLARGLLDPETKAGEAVPALAGSGFAPATLRHLLDMTDGVAFDETYADPTAQVHLYSAAYWTPQAGLGGTLAALAGLSGPAEPPGLSFRYRTPVADVIGWMLRRMTGRTLAQLVADEVWRPAGCGDEAYMLVDTAGMEIAGTGINASPRDLARIGLWLLEPGQADVLGAILDGGDRALFAAAGLDAARAGGSYRSLWWVDHREPAMLSANGVYGQRLWLDPAHQLCVVTLGSHPVAGNSFTDAAHRALFAAIRARLAGI
jgi:CubicO group peptidase (beta-lactamase class C family)